MTWRDLKIGILEEFVDTVHLSRWRTVYGELGARTGDDRHEARAARRERQLRYRQRWREVLNARARARYTPDWRRAKYLRNVDKPRQNAYSRRYHDIHKNDPGYRERAAAKTRAYHALHKSDPTYRARKNAQAIAWQRANRDRVNVRRRARRATHTKGIAK
jgi:hypothetical protein